MQRACRGSTEQEIHEVQLKNCEIREALLYSPVKCSHFRVFQNPIHMQQKKSVCIVRHAMDFQISIISIISQISKCKKWHLWQHQRKIPDKMYILHVWLYCVFAADCSTNLYNKTQKTSWCKYIVSLRGKIGQEAASQGTTAYDIAPQ